MMIRYALVAILILLTSPAWAGERLQPVSDELNFDEPFEQATSKSVLRGLFHQALDLIEDHIELKGNLRPNEERGERQGHVQLKLYPHGKSQSDKHVSAELRFQFSPDDQHFSFGLKLPKESPKTPLYLPDSTL